MRKLILGTMCLVWATSGILLAQDAKDAQQEKIKTLRASLLVKMPALNDVFDNEHNGINTAANAVYRKYQDAVISLTKQIETEDAKGEARDKVAADALRAKQTRINTLWNERATKSGPAWSKNFGDLNVTRLNLVTVVNDLTALSPGWSRADCDRALFVAVLTELHKRVDDVKEQGTALVAEWLKKTEDDARTFQE